MRKCCAAFLFFFPVLYSKLGTGGRKTAPVAFLLRTGQFDPGRETPRIPALSGLGPGGTVSPDHRPLASDQPPGGTARLGRSTRPECRTNQPKDLGSTARRGFFDPQAEKSVPDGLEPSTWGCHPGALADWASNRPLLKSTNHRISSELQVQMCSLY